MHRMLGSAVLAFALLPGFAALAQGAATGGDRGPPMFAKIDGIDGESTVKGHEREIEIFNFSETFRQSASSSLAGGGAGKYDQSRPEFLSQARQIVDSLCYST